MIKSNPTLFFVILCGLIFLVVIINISLFSAFRHRSSRNTLQMGKSAFDRAKNPWEPEDKQREELSELVQQIQKPVNQPLDPDKPDEDDGVTKDVK